MLSERLVRFFFVHGFTMGEPDANNMFEISGYSPAEYHIVEVVDGTSASTIQSSLKTIYEDFDMEEHILKWLEVRKAHPDMGVPNVFALVDDAKWIDSTFEDLCIDFAKFARAEEK